MSRHAVIGVIPLLLACGCATDTGSVSPHDPGLRIVPTVMHWRASTFAAGKQGQAAIAAGPGGAIYTVWSSGKPRFGVFGQRFDAEGRPLGTEVMLSLWPQGQPAAPSVAADPSGGVWVAWQSWEQDGDGGAIVARRFGDGFSGGSEILVNSTAEGDQRSPVIAVAPDGTAAIAWTTSDAEGPSSIRYRLFSRNGQPLGDEAAIQAGPGSQRTPSIACSAQGVFALAFSDFIESGDPAGIRVARIDREGRLLDPPALISDIPGVEPSIGAVGGGFVVSWIDPLSDGNDYGIVARRLDGTTLPIGAPFVVNTSRDGAQVAAAVSEIDNGGFSIAWNGPDGLFIRTFDRDGAPLGDELAVPGDRAMRTATGVARLAHTPGRLFCAWTGKAPDASEAVERPQGVDSRPKPAIGMTMLAFDGFDGRGIGQGVRPGMAPALELPAGAAEPHQPPKFNPKNIDSGRRVILNDGEGGFDAVINTGWTPPDPHMAVGPEHIICMTNGAIRFFLKNGQQTFAAPIEGGGGFWGALGATNFVFDPEVVYDGLSGRFFAMAAEGYEPGNRSHVLVAVSDDSDPNGVWHKYRFETTAQAGNLFDSPNIGVTDDAVIVTGDGFGNGANYPVYVYDKKSMLEGKDPVIKKSLLMQTTTQSAGYPPVSYDQPPAVYFMEHKEGQNNTQIRLAALTDLFGTPTFTYFNLTVPSYGPPGDPPQLGTGTRVETFDARFWSVAYRNGSLWGTHHVNAARALARWYEVRTNGWPFSGLDPVLVQSGNIDPGPSVWTTFSAITADAAGAAAMVFARSASDEPYTMATAYRLPCDPPGTFRAPETQKVTTGPYTAGRWGDYSGIQPDPAVPGKFWAIHEYAINDSWRCWIAPILAKACRPDLTCDGILDLFDFLQFQNFFNAKDPIADCDGNGMFDLFDFLCYVNAFNQGC